MSKPNTPPATAVATADAHAITAPTRASLIAKFADKLGVEPAKLLPVLKDTAFKQPYKDGKPGAEVTDAQMMALLVVSNEYGLNPFTKEIYAFPAKGGGIVPVISVDGWIRIMNARPEFAAIELAYADDEAGRDNYWVEASITRRDRAQPVKIREYLAECHRDTEPWNSHPRRMLRHKAIVQCVRLAFGYAGVYDPDEGERIYDANAIEGSIAQPKPATREPQALRHAEPAPEAPQAALQPSAEEPLLTIGRLLDSTGVPLSELLAHFEAGDLEDLNGPQRQQAIVWLRGINAGA